MSGSIVGGTFTETCFLLDASARGGFGTAKVPFASRRMRRAFLNGLPKRWQRPAAGRFDSCMAPPWHQPADRTRGPKIGVIATRGFPPTVCSRCAPRPPQPWGPVGRFSSRIEEREHAPSKVNDLRTLADGQASAPAGRCRGSPRPRGQADPRSRGAQGSPLPSINALRNAEKTSAARAECVLSGRTVSPQRHPEVLSEKSARSGSDPDDGQITPILRRSWRLIGKLEARWQRLGFPGRLPCVQSNAPLCRRDRAAQGFRWRTAYRARLQGRGRGGGSARQRPPAFDNLILAISEAHIRLRSIGDRRWQKGRGSAAQDGP